MRLIDKDALLDKAEEYYKAKERESAYTGNREICVRWDDAIILINEAEPIEPQPQWIPYEDDTLPEIDEEICVIDIDDNVNWTHRTKYSDWLYDPFGNHLKNIVGWFPLPKMKKEHKGGTDTRGEEDADSD